MHVLKYSGKNKNVSIPILGRSYKPGDSIVVTDNNEKAINNSLPDGWSLESSNKKEVKKNDK